MSNSPLVVHTKISPNKTVNRNNAIDRISPHCVVGQVTAESLGSWFAKESTQASSNYGIDKTGRVGMYVEEKDRSWCTSSRDNDHRAVTIECASDTKHPYAMNEVVYARLIDLCTDICKRNGKTKLLWIADKDRALSYKLASDEMLITVHRWFANKSCPGDWLYERLGDLAAQVTSRLAVKEEPKNEEPKEEVVNKDIRYRVQVGAYSELKNAEDMLTRLRAAGFNGFIVEVEKTETKKEEVWVPEVGDTVYFNGGKHYANANATNGDTASKGKAKITAIHQLGKSKHPYHLKRTGKTGPYGWVDVGSFTKA